VDDVRKIALSSLIQLDADDSVTPLGIRRSELTPEDFLL
jgi:hypothetical protein